MFNCPLSFTQDFMKNILKNVDQLEIYFGPCESSY